MSLKNPNTKTKVRCQKENKNKTQDRCKDLVARNFRVRSFAKVLQGLVYA